MTTVMHMRLLLRHIGSRMYMHTGAYVTLHSSPRDEDEHDMRREEVEEQPEPLARSFLQRNCQGRA